MRSTYPLSLWVLHREYWEKNKENRTGVLKDYEEMGDPSKDPEIDFSRQRTELSDEKKNN